MEIVAFACHFVAVHAPQFSAVIRWPIPACKAKTSGSEVTFMFRRLPILLVIFITTGAHAEQGFLEQLFGSSKNTTTTGEPAVENTGASGRSFVVRTTPAPP